MRKPRAFRVFLGFNSTTLPGNAKVRNALFIRYRYSPDSALQKPQVVLNEDATLAEMERMGRGMVVRIVRHAREDA